MIETVANALGLPFWAAGSVLVATAFAARYFLMAGGALTLTQAFQRRLAPLRIQKQAFTTAQFRREFFWSMVSIASFAVFVGLAIAWRGPDGPGGLYTDIRRHGWLWMALSVPVALLLHDAYFYWTHRLLHRPGVMKLWHSVHHQSHNPSPLASLAFHPVEALVNAVGVSLIFAVLPMHVAAFAVFALLSFAFNVMGHLGYELLPRWLLRSPVGYWLNTATSHNLHHRSYEYQFGLYTLIWDRLCGTIHPRYDAMRREADSAPAKQPQSSTLEMPQ